MRPLPFSVWKARRTVVSDSTSSGFSRQTGSVLPMVSSTSTASSRNTWSSSGSTPGRDGAAVAGCSCFVSSRSGCGSSAAAAGALRFS